MVKIEMTWINGDVDELSYDGCTKCGVRVHKSPGFKTTMKPIDAEEMRSLYCYIKKTTAQLAEMTEGRLVSFKKWYE